MTSSFPRANTIFFSFLCILWLFLQLTLKKWAFTGGSEIKLLLLLLTTPYGFKALLSRDDRPGNWVK